MCSNPGQEMIVQDIQELGLNRVVVAACSPRMHERTFRNACKSGGLNPYLCDMANIREQCSWVHADKLAATEKAKALTRAAVNRVRHQEPLDSLTAEMCPSTLVLGGGIAGHAGRRSELAMAGQSRCTWSRETDRLGGNLARVDSTAPYLDSARDLLTERIHTCARIPTSRSCSRLPAQESLGFHRQFLGDGRRPTRANPPERRPSDVGNVIVATGYKEFDASRDHALRLRQAARRNYLFRIRADAARRPDSDQERPHCRSTSPSSTVSARAARNSTAIARVSAA